MKIEFPKSNFKNIYLLLFFVLSHHFYAQQTFTIGKISGRELPVKTNPKLKWLVQKNESDSPVRHGNTLYTMNADSIWIYSKARFRDAAGIDIKPAYKYSSLADIKFRNYDLAKQQALSVNRTAINANDYILASYNNHFRKPLTVNVPPTAITGNPNVCFPGTTQLIGSGAPAAVNPWSSSNPSAATVSSTGLVTGVALGATTITYTDILGSNDAVTVFITAPPTISGTLMKCVAGTTQLTGSGTPSATNPWTSSNTSVATVNATGLVTGVSAGSAIITYTNSNTCTATATVTFNTNVTPVITCGAATTSSVTFNWAAVPGATTYTIQYNIGAGNVFFGNIGGLLTYTQSGVNPASNVTIIVTPSGAFGSCYAQGTLTCMSAACTGAMIPAPPTVAVTQPTCAVATGDITITAAAGMTYSFDGGLYSATLAYPGLAAGSSHTIKAKNTATGCVSADTNVTLNAQPATPAAPAYTVTQPSCTVATGTINITGVTGETYSFDLLPYSGTLIYPGLAAGSSHTITAKNAAGCISSVTNVTLNAQPAIPAAPAYIVTQPTCTVATGTITITAVAGETYSFDLLPYSGTLVYPGLAAGSSHTITAKNAVGCISSVTNVTLNTQPATPGTPAYTVTQPSCTVATGTVNITAVAGETYSFDLLPYSGTLVYPGLAAGSSHTITAKNAAGCISSVTNVTLNAQPVTPAAPVYTVTQPSCTVATGTITITGVAGETYSFDLLPYSGTLIYPGLAAGSSHTITAKNAAGCISSVTNVTLNAQPAIPAAPVYTVIQPTCTVATGTINITGVAGETYSFDLLPYSGTLIYPGLAAGSSHTITAKNAVGCISSVTNVTLNAQPATPGVPAYTATQPTCTVTTGTITITAVAGETYSFDLLPYSGTLVYPGLAAGSTHTITAKNVAGCISSVTNVTLNAQPATPGAPAYTVTQPSCTVATGTVNITAVAGETYSFDLLPYSGTLVYPGLAAGSSHTITAKNAVGCISSVTNVTLNVQPATPAAPAYTVTQPSCTVATGTVNITAVAGETYSFDLLPYSGTLIYPGLAAGSSHTITAKNAVGCISSVTNVTLNAQPVTPAAPIINVTQPTCTAATGTATITGVAGETYSFDLLPYSGTLVYPGLAAGSSHTITAKNAVGCISSVTNVTLNAQPTSPSAPAYTVTQPTCTVASGTITITAVAGETYSFDLLPYSGTLVYPGLAAGSSHTITAKNAAGCISSVTNVTLNVQPATPAAPGYTVTQATCTVATGAINITGVPGETYSFDTAPYAATLIYSGLAAGSSHTITAKNAAGCISSVTNVTLNTQPATPGVPAYTATQSTCTVATGTITITGVPGETYSFDLLPYSGTLVYPGLAAGSSHTITAKNAAGCISSVTNVTLNAQPAIPAAPAYIVTQPTCTVATGTINITGVAGETYSFDLLPYSGTLVYPGLAAGSSHTITAKNAVGCVSTVTNVTLNTQPATPGAPAYTVTQPSCTVATGTVNITAVAGETYSFDLLPYSGTLVYPGLAAGSSHTITAKNAAGCISSVTNVTLNAQPVTPAAPVYTVTQPSCTVATGTITITGVAGETYSFDLLPYSGTLIYPGLAAGSSHTITAKNAAGCISSVTNVTLNAQPAIPAAPAYTIIQPTCTVATGTINITGVAGETYSFDLLPYSGTLVYPGLAAGSSHTITAKNAVGCISSVTNVTLNVQPATPGVPAYTATQPTCTVATGTITITGVPGETYSFDLLPYSGALIYATLAAGSSHTITAKNAAGCISSVTNVTLNAQPVTPAAPAYTVIQPTCTVATGTISITAVAGETYSFDLLPYSGTLIYPGLVAGSSHTITAKNAVGCISSVTNVMLNAQPATPVAPAYTIIQPTCTIATGTITITAVAGETYSFDLLPYSGTLIYPGLAAGSTHTITTKNVVGCISSVTNVTLNAQPVTPAAPIINVTQPTCTAATGTATITGVAGETYSFDLLPYSGTLVYPGLAAGSSHTITAKNAVGCISSVTNVTLNAQPTSPSAPAYTVTQPTCTVASGTITITAVAGETYSFDLLPYSGTLVYPGLAAGSSHTITAKNAAGCISSVTNVTLNVQPAIPAAPVYTVTQPTCTVTTGTININGVAGETYSFDLSPYSGTLIYPGLAAGSSHTITAKNAVGCISSVTNVTLNAQPVTPAAPIINVTQPTCTAATGTATITGVAGETYSFDFAPYSSTLIYPGLAAGSAHMITAKNAAGCISLFTTIILNTQPVTPAAPIFTVTQPTCTVATGTITINGTAGLTYSLDAAPYSTVLIYSGLAAGSSHTITAKNAVGCISAIVTVALSAQPPTPIAPILTATSPSCKIATGTITITGVAGETYSFDSGSYSAALVYGSLAAGSTHTVTAKNTFGCISSASSITISTQPQTPVAIATPASESICTANSNNIVLSGTMPGTTYTWTVVQSNASGASDGAGNTINQLLETTGSAIGTATYTIIPTNSNGCIGNALQVVVTVNPLPNPKIKDGIICIDKSTGATIKSYYLNTGLNDSTHDFVWTLDGSATPIPGAVDSSYEATEPGTYTVIATNIVTGCISLPVSAIVTESFAGQTITATAESFSSNPVITVKVTPANPLYQYQLDGGQFQSSGTFTNVDAGLHTVVVTDSNGCTDLTTQVLIIDYPKFFTPNGDGFNDTWNIIGLNTQATAKIYIFDRYGKFIQQLNPTLDGWDGTDNGYQLPATDYWFTVEYFEDNQKRVFKSHFALKR